MTTRSDSVAFSAQKSSSTYIRTAPIPEENAKDLAEIADPVKRELEIIPVSRMDEVLAREMTRNPDPIEGGMKPRPKRELDAGPLKRPKQRRNEQLQVLVRDNNIDQALRILKKKMQREGLAQAIL